LLVQNADQVAQSQFALRMHMRSNPLSDAMNQFDGQRLYLQPNFDVTEEPHVLVEVARAASPNFNRIFKLIMIY